MSQLPEKREHRAMMAEFGALARRLPQDPAPSAPAAYPFFRRSDNVEDRRDQRLTALEEARILMGQLDKPQQYPAASMPQTRVGPLSIDAGILDVVPSHERWLAERIGATPSAITSNGGASAASHVTQPYYDLLDRPKEK